MSTRRRELISRLPSPPGDCADCAWTELLESMRAVFVRCGRSRVDPRFPRYPPLPVAGCPGYDPAERTTEEEGS